MVHVPPAGKFLHFEENHRRWPLDAFPVLQVDLFNTCKCSSYISGTLAPLAETLMAFQTTFTPPKGRKPGLCARRNIRIFHLYGAEMSPLGRWKDVHRPTILTLVQSFRWVRNVFEPLCRSFRVGSYTNGRFMMTPIASGGVRFEAKWRQFKYETKTWGWDNKSSF